MTFRDVSKFHKKFRVPVANEPSFLSDRAFQYRYNFLSEELQEFYNSYRDQDLPGMADALIDLVYVAYGTACMMGLPWGQLWKEVQRANMSKVRAKKASDSKRGTALDIVKPEGWQGPNFLPILGEGPFPTFFPEGGDD